MGSLAFNNTDPQRSTEHKKTRFDGIKNIRTVKWTVLLLNLPVSSFVIFLLIICQIDEVFSYLDDITMSFYHD